MFGVWLQSIVIRYKKRMVLGAAEGGKRT